MPTSEQFIDLAFERLDLGAIEIELDAKGDEKVYIHHFKSTFPNEGNGRDAMQSLLGLADSEGITLVLFAKAEHGPHYLSQQDLQSWYQRLGFEPGDFYGHFERRPQRLPYAAETWDDRATLITASGVEWFKDIGQRDARLEEFDSGVAAFVEGKRPSEEAARAAVETWLDEHAPGYPDYSLHEDGDDGWAFHVATEDTTSYVHHDLNIEWYGTGWPENYQYDEETGDWSSVSPSHQAS